MAYFRLVGRRVCGTDSWLWTQAGGAKPTVGSAIPGTAEPKPCKTKGSSWARLGSKPVSSCGSCFRLVPRLQLTRGYNLSGGNSLLLLSCFRLWCLSQPQKGRPGQSCMHVTENEAISRLSVESVHFLFLKFWVKQGTLLPWLPK